MDESTQRVQAEALAAADDVLSAVADMVTRTNQLHALLAEYAVVMTALRDRTAGKMCGLRVCIDLKLDYSNFVAVDTMPQAKAVLFLEALGQGLAVQIKNTMLFLGGMLNHVSRQVFVGNPEMLPPQVTLDEFGQPATEPADEFAATGGS